MSIKCVSDTGELVYSDYQTIEYSTPQGSVLGPLIFLIFNNDLHLHLIYCNCILFADDTTIYHVHKDLRHLTWCIQEDLCIIKDWFCANKLTLNIEKSGCLLFGANKRTKSQCLNELKIPIADNTKFLGICIDDRLNWNAQFSHVVLKMKHNLHMLRISANFLNINAKKLIYYRHIYSHLSYCISTWGPMLQQSQINKLQSIQNKCVSLIDCRKYDLVDKFNKLRILSVQNIINMELAKIGYHLMKHELPDNLLSCFLHDSSNHDLQKIHRYGTHQKSLQNLLLVKNNKYKQSFLCKSIKAIQPLLVETHSLSNIHQLVSRYKQKIFATS